MYCFQFPSFPVRFTGYNRASGDLLVTAYYRAGYGLPFVTAGGGEIPFTVPFNTVKAASRP